MSKQQLIRFASKSFTLPHTCVRLREALDNPRLDTRDIGKIISVDPSLSAKVLKLANSALFRFPSQIETIDKALNVLGGEAVYNISIAETANVAFHKFANDSLNVNDFWLQAVTCGVVAKSIAQQVQARGSDRFFALGILQSFSELLAALKMPEQYTHYINDEHIRVPLNAQSDYFKFTFPNCTGHILEEWKLPQSIVTPLKLLTDPPTSRLGQEESILYTAIAMTYANTKGLHFLHLKNFNYQASDLLALSDEEYEMIMTFAKLESGKIANLML